MKTLFRAFIAITIAVTSFSCAGQSKDGNFHVTHSLYVDTLTLSAVAPVNKAHKIRFISVSKDGSTTIQDISSGQKLSATPGKAFACESFGSSGLVLESSSFQQQSATFSRYSCETTTR